MASKVELKDYQKSILDKLASVKADASGAAVSYLGVDIGGRHVLVNLLEISETLTMTDIQPVPLVQPWFLGMTNVRGTLYAVNDLMYLLDSQLSEISSDTRLLLINERIASNVGFVVNRLVGLRSLDMFHPIADASEDSICFAKTRYEDDKKEVWHVLDCQKLAHSKAFEAPYAAA